MSVLLMLHVISVSKSNRKYYCSPRQFLSFQKRIFSNTKEASNLVVFVRIVRFVHPGGIKRQKQTISFFLCD